MIRLEPGPSFRKPRNGPLALGETRGPGNTGSAVGYTPRPAATGPLRPLSRETPPEEEVAPDTKPFIRPAEAVLPSSSRNRFRTNTRNPEEPPPLDPVADPVRPCTGEMIALPDQYHKFKSK